MVVIMTGEGPTDYGRLDYGTKVWKEGPAAILLRKTLAAQKINYTSLIFVQKEKVHTIKLQRTLSGLKNRGIPCAKFLTYIATGRIEGLSKSEDKLAVFYTDADKAQGEKNSQEAVCRQLFNELHKEINVAVKKTNVSFGCVVMMPIKMIESWLLSDENAFKAVFSTEECSFLPHKPELLWGTKTDIKSNYPKNAMNRLLDRLSGGRITDGSQEIYNEIAEKTDITVLKEKCPISFLPFYDEITLKNEE